MFGLQILDVAIGLVFVFLLLSLVVTAANELAAAWLKRRSATMWRGVVRLLGGEAWASAVYAHPLITGMNDKAWFEKRRQNLPFQKRPSYIPPKTFALALLDTLAPGGGDVPLALQDKLAANKDDHLARTLSVLLADAKGDLDEFEKRIEEWFNASMERVTGWYKRRTLWISVGFAVVLTVAVNADTIHLANALWRDPATRAALVGQAQQYSDQERRQDEAAGKAPVQTAAVEPPDRLPYDAAEAAYDTASAKFQQTVSRLEGLAIPLGWRDASQGGDGREPLPSGWSEWGDAVGRHFLGWLLTALAISLGSPFWFDTLNKVIAVRTSVKPSSDEDQKRNK